jgi:hypothetical protein
VQLENLLSKYKSLGTKHKKKWDAVRLGAEGLADVRSKITFHTSAVSLFITTMGTSSLGRIEAKLDQIADDVRQGKVLETEFVSPFEEPEASKEAKWHSLRDRLVEDGFEEKNLDIHEEWIRRRFHELVDRPRASFIPETTVDVTPISIATSPAERSERPASVGSFSSVRSDVSVYISEGRVTRRAITTTYHDHGQDREGIDAERAERILRLSGLERLPKTTLRTAGEDDAAGLAFKDPFTTEMTRYSPLDVFQAHELYYFLRTFFEGWSLLRPADTDDGELRCRKLDPDTGMCCSQSCQDIGELLQHERFGHNGQQHEVRCHLCSYKTTFSDYTTLRHHVGAIHGRDAVDTLPPHMIVAEERWDPLSNVDSELAPKVAHLEKRAEDQRKRLTELEANATKYELLFRAQTHYRLKAMQIFAKLGLAAGNWTGSRVEEALIAEMTKEMSMHTQAGNGGPGDATMESRAFSGTGRGVPVLAPANLDLPKNKTYAEGFIDTEGGTSMEALTSMSLPVESPIDTTFLGSHRTFSTIEQQVEDLVQKISLNKSNS